MKTRFFLLILVCFLSVSGITAQSRQGTTYYYKETKTFYENGYTYQCDVEKGLPSIYLYNKENRLTYVDLSFKDGSPLTEDYFEGNVPFTKLDTWTGDKCNSILNNAFQASIASGSLIFVTMYISPETGKVIEVNFWFNMNRGFGTVPVSTFRKIELELKKNIWFTPTEYGKKLNYIMCCWRYEVPRYDGGSSSKNRNR